MQQTALSLCFIALCCFAFGVAATDRTVALIGSDIGNCVASPCASLSYAVQQSSNGDTISMLSGIYTHLSTYNVLIDNLSLTITGELGTVIDCGSNAGSWNIINSTQVQIFSLSVRNCYNSSSAGTGASFLNVESTVVWVDRCKFANNSAPNALGGVISSFYNPVDNPTPGWVSVTNTIFVGNSAQGGGVIYSLVNVVLINCTFVNNQALSGHGGAVLVLAGTIPSNPLTLEVDVTTSNFTNNLASYSGGAIACLPTAIAAYQLSVQSSTFIGNAADYGGAILVKSTGGSYLYVSQSVFLSNAALVTYGSAIAFVISPGSNTPGTVYLQSCVMNNHAAAIENTVRLTGPTALFVYDSEFSNNQNGVIAQMQGISMSIERCNFTANTGQTEGASIAADLGSNSLPLMVTISDCFFTQNEGSQGSVMNLMLNSDCETGQGSPCESSTQGIQITRCIFVSNPALDYTGSVVIDVQGSANYQFPVTITDSIFFNSSAALSLSGDRLQATLTNTNISYHGDPAMGTESRGAAIFIAGGALVSVKGGVFSHNTASTGGAVYVSYGGISCIGTLFVNNKAQMGGAVYILNGLSDNSFESSVFLQNSAREGGALYVMLNTYQSIFMMSSSFIANTATLNGGVVSTQPGALLFASSTLFWQNTAGKSGGVGVLSGQATFMECNMTANTAQAAGGALDTSASLTIMNSVLEGNVAVSGGAVSVQTTGSLDSKQNTYLSNSGYAGGALYFASSGLAEQQIVSQCVFSGNFARTGSVLYWSTVDAEVNLVNCNVTSDNHATDGALYATNPLSLQVANLTILSPNLVSVVVYAVDFYNQTVIYPPTPFSILPELSIGVCAGGTSAITPTLDQGTATFRLTLNAPAGFSVAANFYSSDTSIQSASADTIILSPCNVGEFSVSLAGGCSECASCPFDTYSLSSNSSCLSCSDNPLMFCPGGAQVLSVVNSWVIVNPNLGIATAYTCENTNCAAAIVSDGTETPVRNGTSSLYGSVPSWVEGRNRCVRNSTGYMCGDCLEGYSLWSGVCTDCSSPRTGLLLLALLGNWVYVVVVHLLLVSGGGGALIQTTIDYFQSAQLVLPPHYNSLFTDILSGLNGNLPSGGTCLYPRDYWGSYLQQFVMVGVSHTQLIVAILVIMWVYRLRGQVFVVSRWMVLPALSLGLSFYTPLTDLALSMLRTRTVGEYTVLSESPSLWTFNSAGQISSVYLPYLIASLLILAVITAGFPLVFAFLFWRLSARKLWEDNNVIQQFGILFSPYKETIRWWLLFVLIRRSFIAALLSVENTSVRALLLAAVLLAVCLVQLSVRPYSTLLDNVGACISYSSLTLVALAAMGFTSQQGSLDLRSLQISLDVIQVVTIVSLAVLIFLANYAKVLERLKSLKALIASKLFGKTNSTNATSEPLLNASTRLSGPYLPMESVT